MSRRYSPNELKIGILQCCSASDTRTINPRSWKRWAAIAFVIRTVPQVGINLKGTACWSFQVHEHHVRKVTELRNEHEGDRTAVFVFESGSEQVKFNACA